MSAKKQAKKAAKKKTVEWKSTQTANLVRRNESTYYAQLKIAGKTYRKSLATKKVDVARMKLPQMLNSIRAAADSVLAFGQGEGCETLRGCLELWYEGEKARPDLKVKMHEFNDRRYKTLSGGEYVLPGAPAGKVTIEEYRKWWKKVAEHYNARYANNVLSIARLCVQMQFDAGLVAKNPLIDFKKMRIAKTVKDIPSGAQMAELIASVRATDNRYADESADMISMMAYTGMRPGEVQRLCGRDILDEVIVVRMGEEGTKNYEERTVPILAEVKLIAAQRRKIEGSIWSIKQPNKGMRAASVRLELDYVVTPYSCRHFFATRCLESEVPVPTVAKWLGHKDGGITLMKTYSHITDAHGLEAAKKVKMG